MKFKSEIVTQASGSIGGTTYSRNRGGLYRRARSIPTNPNTAKQVVVRAALSAAVNNWTNALTAANRSSWNNYAANTPTTDVLGDPLILTGQQMYVGAYVPRALIGAVPPTTAPTVNDRGAPITSFRSSIGLVPNELGTTAGDLSSDAVMSSLTPDDGNTLLFVGRSVNPSVNYYRGPYQFCSATAFTAGDPGVALIGTIATFPLTDPIVVGQRRPVRLVNIYDDGRTSIPFEVITTVVADA